MAVTVELDSELGTIVRADKGCSGIEKFDERGDEMGEEDGGDLIAIADDAEKLRECDNDNDWAKSGELVSLPVGVPR